MAEHPSVRGFPLVSVKVYELHVPVLVHATDYAVLVVTKYVNGLMAVRYRGVRAPKRYDVNPTRYGRVLHASDHSFLIVDIMQYAITDDDVEIALQGIIGDIGNYNVYKFCYTRFGRESPDLGGTDLTYLYCVDEIAEQRQPDRVSSFAGSYVKRSARRPCGEGTQGHLGEQRGRVGCGLETGAVVLMPPVTLPASVEVVEQLTHLHRGRSSFGQQGTLRVSHGDCA